MTAGSCGHDEAPGGDTLIREYPHIALVGSPNAGKTSIFNALTGMHAKTGNFPGVTVTRHLGTTRVGGERLIVEDLPGTYSLEPLSPDEQVVADVLDGRLADTPVPDGLIVVVDATTLRRSLALVTQVLARRLPTIVAVTFTDELAARAGALRLPDLATSLGVPVVAVLAHREHGLDQLRDLLGRWGAWPQPISPPPTDEPERDAWIESVCSLAGYRAPHPHRTTSRVDAVLLHPVAGTLVFFAVMVAFFQIIFSAAAPAQSAVEGLFRWLAALVNAHVSNRWLDGLLADGLIGGVGGVLAFVPQIMLLFLLVAVLEGTGYMTRAAFLMDRVMARAGLEGRAFVALLSSVACAVPGIMATRTLPSARDRVATMMGAPLMTCSARLPVYLLLIGLVVDPSAHVGPLGAQGLVMFALYLGGAVAAMTAAWVVKRVTGRRGPELPFYMEMPPYRIPSLRTVALAMWDSSRAFVRKCSTIILTTTALLWLLLNLPAPSSATLTHAGVNPADRRAVATYTINHSLAADVGHAAEPIFAPLGFDWRITVGVLSAQSARETFVATIGQVAAAGEVAKPHDALRAMTRDGPAAPSRRLFDPATVAALLAYFALALQCMATMGIMRRETGGWRWPLTAFATYTASAWLAALVAHTLVSAAVG